MDVEWFARSDARSVVARSDSRPNLPKTAGAKRVITQLLWSGVSKVQMIKQIEHLHPELGVDTLRNRSGVEEREIDVFKARPTLKLPAGSIDSSPLTPKSLRQKISETSKALPVCGGAG